MPDSREQRDELLLELGALVYELHRLERRAPELLTAKADELDAIDAELRPPDPDELFCTCCGTAAEEAQLVCIGCGSRIALAPALVEEPAWDGAEIVVEDARGAEPTSDAIGVETWPEDEEPTPAPLAAQTVAPPYDPRRPLDGSPDAPDTPAAPIEAVENGGGWRRALTAGAVAVVVAGATLGILLAVTQGGDGSPSPPPSKRLNTPARPAPASPPQPARTADGLASWGSGSGYTVVLLTTGDLGSARITARRLTREGVDAGLVHRGRFWLVFSGRYRDAAAAQTAAAGLRERLGAAYVQLVDPQR
jgi:hypothetical protein